MKKTIDSLPPGESHPHGTRARYVGAKCRCEECKRANREYYHKRQKEREEAFDASRVNPGPARPVPQSEFHTPSTSWRVFTHVHKTTKQLEWQFAQFRVTGQGFWNFRKACPGIDGKPCSAGSALRRSKHGICNVCRAKMGWNGLVDATPAREHLHTLSKRQVGYKQVADAAGISETVMAKIASGKRKKIRFLNLQAILEVDESARADSALVNGKEVRRLIKKMVTMGYTRTELASRFGIPVQNFYFRGRVTTKTDHKVKKLYNQIMEEQRIMQEMKKFCEHCGRSHAKENRQRILKTILPATTGVIKELYPCFYDDTDAKVQDLSRDLRAIGAYKEGPKCGAGAWHLPGKRGRFSG